MDRNVIMTLNDFATVNTLLLEKTGLALYRSESYEHPFRRIEKIDRAAWEDSGLRALALLVGSPADEARILGPRQFDVKRAARVGFVSVRFGGEDADAIGASHYGADGSATMKLVNRELNKLLKKLAHRGVVDAGHVEEHMYWTDAALASGKNWHRFMRSGQHAHRNKEPGYRPLPA
jgi:hypothetical protein